MSEINITNIIEIVGFAAVLVGIHVRNQVKFKELEMRLNSAENSDNRVIDKLDRIQTDINEIKIELQNKQDRE